MSPKRMEICFDNPSKAYFAGKTVLGQVRLTLASEMKIQSNPIFDLLDEKSILFNKHNLQVL